ncbi:MAG: MFS transporter [Deltaproteobacteria bacterium]
MLCILGVILYIDRVCIAIALPAIQKELALEPQHLGWISLAFSLSYALFEIPTGHLGDRYGTRKTLMRITIAWSVFTALTGATFGLVSLLVVRFLFGAGEAGAWPNVSTVVSKWFPAPARGRAMGVFGAATAIGGGLSPFLVIPLQRAYGWRASFFVFAVLGVVWAIVWYRWFRDDLAEMGTPLDEIAEVGDVPIRAAHGLAWRIALRQPSLWGLMGAGFSNIYAAFFSIFWLPTYLTKARGFDDDELKWTAATWIAAVIGNSSGGWISDFVVQAVGRGRGRRAVAMTCAVVVGTMLALVARTPDKVTVIALLTVAGLAWGVIQANVFATCIDVGGLHVGTVSGTMNMAGQLGGAISALSFGYLVKLTGSYDVPVVVMAVVITVGAASWWWIDASTPIDA